MKLCLVCNKTKDIMQFYDLNPYAPWKGDQTYQYACKTCRSTPLTKEQERNAAQVRRNLREDSNA